VAPLAARPHRSLENLIHKEEKIRLKPLPLPKVPKPKEIPPDSAEHRMIGNRFSTVKANIRDSMLCLYCSLTADHKIQLPASDEFDRMLEETQTFLMQHSLVSDFIGPTSSIQNTNLYQETSEWIMEKLEDVPLSDCRFAIVGPHESGKSTMLNIAVTLFFQRLLLSGDLKEYVIVPINWQNHSFVFDNLRDLYSLYVKVTLQGLKITNMKYFVILEDFRHWLLSLITVRGFPLLSAQIRRFQNFPVGPIVRFGREIYESWNSRGGLESFVRNTVRMPTIIAQTLGLSGAVYVFDHFDAAGFLIEDEDHFPESSPVDFPRVLCDALCTSPFFIASQQDSEFTELFTLDNSITLSTERLIKNLSIGEIAIRDLGITLNFQMCHGCPGYCSRYVRLLDLVEKSQRNRAVKGRASQHKAVVDISRAQAIKHELIKLYLLFREANFGTDLGKILDDDSQGDR
jgi:hypothetical protein